MNKSYVITCIYMINGTPAAIFGWHGSLWKVIHRYKNWEKVAQGYTGLFGFMTGGGKKYLKDQTLIQAGMELLLGVF